MTKMLNSPGVELIDFAIQNEKDAYDFYKMLAGMVKDPAVKAVFEDFAAEEQGHRIKLEQFKAGKTFHVSVEKIQDLKLSDYLVDVQPHAEMSYQEALMLAMHKEKAAFRLYTDLAARAGSEVKSMLLGLAQEEAKHKLRFEVEYDERILTEN